MRRRKREFKQNFDDHFNDDIGEAVFHDDTIVHDGQNNHQHLTYQVEENGFANNNAEDLEFPVFEENLQNVFFHYTGESDVENELDDVASHVSSISTSSSYYSRNADSEFEELSNDFDTSDEFPGKNYIVFSINNYIKE